MPFAVQHIDHVEAFVRDLDAATRWYADVLGLQLIHRWDPQPIMLGAGNTKLALFQAAPDAPRPPRADSSSAPSWHRVAWLTDRAGLDAAQKHLAERGIPYRGPIDHGLAHSLYFDDPDGNPLEITCYV